MFQRPFPNHWHHWRFGIQFLAEFHDLLPKKPLKTHFLVAALQVATELVLHLEPFAVSAHECHLPKAKPDWKWKLGQEVCLSLSRSQIRSKSK